MELSYAVIYSAVDALNELAAKEWPVKVSLALTKLLKNLSGPYETVSKVRNGVIAKHAPEETPNKVEPEDENWAAFVAEHNELMTETEEVEVEKVILPQMVDDKEVSVKPSTLNILEGIVEFE